MLLRKGNLFSSECDIIAHGVNCRGAFGSGVAGQIARLFPLAKEEYVRKFKSKEKWKLGDVQFVRVNEKLIIANCATQYNYGTDKVHVDYDAVASIFNKIIDYAEPTGLSIAVPKIGCGLAGGDWSCVSNIIQQTLQNRKVHLEVWEF
jgi:O-acetyl-ADP-ribose deacetylase (regulator of RNase III)